MYGLGNKRPGWAAAVRLGQRIGRCVLPTNDQEIPEIAPAIDLADSKAGARWASLLGGRYVERADSDDADADAFYPHRAGEFPRSPSR